MNKFTIITSLLSCTALLGACNTSDGGDYPSHVAMTTVQVPAATDDYYFLLDDGKSIYPGDKSRIRPYDTKDKDGKRAIVYLRILEEPSTGYDYNAALYDIQDVLTKSVEAAETEEALELLGDDPIEVETAWISGGWLNICYSLSTDGNADRRHLLSLVENKTATPPADMPEGYTCLEFRHNAHDDTGGISAQNYVCFRLDDIAESKGIYLRVKPLFGKAVYMKISPAKSNI